MKKLISILTLTIALLLPQTAFGWNATGHELVASIAWDNLSPTARGRIIDLLLKAPDGACLKEMFQATGPNEDERKREFFVEAATWSDVVRPKNKDDHRPCTSFHRRDWHFVDHFWKGVSGSATNPPTDLSTPPMAATNAVERLLNFRPVVVSNNAPADRAIDLAWILHLVGDIHQPLHTSGRVTATETSGDAGGNTFALGPKLNLHSYWDGIVDRAKPRHTPNETFPSYIKRLTSTFEADFPKSHFSNLQPGQFDAWAKESFQKAKNNAYPKSLKRDQMPSAAYQSKTFGIAEESIAEGGYRLENLLETLFGGN